ncbi:MAG: bifunctional 5,10-methylenetetrahydrofolate dehydrogenase/5,10-methenyltetrahydrofolate cyclohydrolase [Lawsonibacter sp.]
MAILLSGIQVSEALRRRIRAEIVQLRERNVVPTLGIVRVGARPEDMSYERGATRLAQSLGIAVVRMLQPEDVSEEELIEVLGEVNASSRIHGCLLFRPLPARLNTMAVLGTLRPEKDIDAMTGTSMGGLMIPAFEAFPPCTAAACLELLRHYQIPLPGKNIVIVGTGITVGMPTAILLMNQGATVSACNILTDPKRMQELCRGADIIISAAGKAGLIGREHVRAGQVVVDVGVSQGPDGKMHGDVDFAQVEPIVAALTPVPGGVGAVTSTVLSAHTVKAALQAHGLSPM